MKLHFYFILKKNKNLDEAITYSHIKPLHNELNFDKTSYQHSVLSTHHHECIPRQAINLPSERSGGIFEHQSRQNCHLLTEM
jgi:TRAP-type uncharacterized transport system substrate-binding protein